MAKQTHILFNGDGILEIELDGGDRATAVFKTTGIYEEREFKVTRDAGDPLELLKDIQEQACFADEPKFPNDGWEAPCSPDIVEVTFTNEDGNKRIRKWNALKILKNWEGDAMLCPPNDTELESATWNGKDLLVDANCCGEVGLTPGKHTFEDLMKLIRVLRDFPAETIKGLADEGILFSICAGRIEYLANYSYVRGVIDPEDRSIRLLDGVAECDNAIIKGYHYPETHEPEQVLRDLAEAAGTLDQAMYNAEETLSDYDDEKDK